MQNGAADKSKNFLKSSQTFPNNRGVRFPRFFSIAHADEAGRLMLQDWSARFNRNRDAFSGDDWSVIALYRGRNLKRRGGGNLKFVSDRTDIVCHGFGESGYDWIRRKRRSLIAFRSPCHIDETRAAHLFRVRVDFEFFFVATAEIKSTKTKQS